MAFALACSLYAARATSAQSTSSPQSVEPVSSESAPTEPIDPDAPTPAESSVDDDYGFGAETEVEVPAARHSADPTAAGTSIDVDPTSDLASVLSSAPGARPLVTGPAGSFLGLSLRGAELGHTTVVFDDLPLAGPDTGAFDFSLIPVGALDRIEIFRGGAPAWFGEGSIGGVVRLLPLEPTTRRLSTVASIGAGSFGLWSARGVLSAGSATLSSTASIGVRSSRGDHPYLDDGGTRLRTDDDVERRRTNAETFDADVFGTLTARLRRGRLRLLYLGVSRHQGEPGPAASPARHASRRRHRGFVGATWERTRSWGRLQVAIGGGYDRNRFFDPLAEIGTGRFDTDDRTTGLFARVAGERTLTSWFDLTGVLNTRFDSNRPRDAWSEAPQNQARRVTTTAAVEGRAHRRIRHGHVELRPSIRLLHTHVRATEVVLGIPLDDARSAWVPTWRVGALVAPRPWLALVGSYARGARLPTFLELFGDRGLLLSNPSLSPERAESIDLGVQLRGRRGPVSGAFEARGFELSLRDLIRYRRTAQFTAVAENIERGTVRGLEIGWNLEIGSHVRWNVAWTELRTETEVDRDLPLRPRRIAQLCAESRLADWLGERGVVEDVALEATVSHVGDAFADPANLVSLRARSWLDLGLRVSLRRPSLAFALSVRDVLDRRGTDLLGYPLPGRRVEAVLQGRLERE